MFIWLSSFSFTRPDDWRKRSNLRLHFSHSSWRLKSNSSGSCTRKDVMVLLTSFSRHHVTLLRGETDENTSTQQLLSSKNNYIEHLVKLARPLRLMGTKRLHHNMYITTPPPPKKDHLRSHSRAIMALDHNRLGLENKFFPNKITQSPTYSTYIL